MRVQRLRLPRLETVEAERQAGAFEEPAVVGLRRTRTEVLAVVLEMLHGRLRVRAGGPGQSSRQPRDAAIASWDKAWESKLGSRADSEKQRPLRLAGAEIEGSPLRIPPADPPRGDARP